MPKVQVWTRKDGAEPNGVYPKISQVVEMGEYSGQVAQPVSIVICDAAGIDLVNDTIVPSR